jgi:hypothetical protein
LTNLRELAKKIPGAKQAYRALRAIARRTWSTEKVFSDIYHGNKFGGRLSVSGRGSELEQTRVLIEQLPVLMREWRIGSLLDIPCGDFFWMRHVDLTGIDYVGADIVKEIVESNRQHQRTGVRFERVNLISDRLPKADMVLCRDCLVHLSFADAERSLRNICASGARLLLTTTFPDRTRNRDIDTGGWRTLNLEMPPFSFPPPLRLLNEQCTEWQGAYADKSLGLWRIPDVAEALRTKLTSSREAPRNAGSHPSAEPGKRVQHQHRHQSNNLG